MHNFLANLAESFAPFSRGITIASIILIAVLILWLIMVIPLRSRYRLGSISLALLAKLIVALFVTLWTAAAVWVMCTYPILLAAKLWIINLLIVGTLLCWFFIATSSSWSRALTAIQNECELANNLVFLQGEMVRSQLESLAVKIRASAQPEQRELAETMLKSISPVVMLFLGKERSLMKWSMVALNVGKSLMSYLWSEKK